MSLFSWVEDLIEDFKSMLRRSRQDVDNQALQKLRDSSNKLPDAWTEDGAPQPEYAQELSELTKEAEELIRIIDKLQNSIETASDIVREGDRTIKNKVESLEDSFRNI